MKYHVPFHSSLFFRVCSLSSEHVQKVFSKTVFPKRDNSIFVIACSVEEGNNCRKLSYYPNCSSLVCLIRSVVWFRVKFSKMRNSGSQDLHGMTARGSTSYPLNNRFRQHHFGEKVGLEFIQFGLCGQFVV